MNDDRKEFAGKIFCIGANKTGTTSLKKAFTDLGFTVGKQSRAELLINDYAEKNFTRIIDYCRTAQVFQDVPFSWEGTFKVVDKAYPGSKFILTVRDSPEQWYDSLVNFHSRIFGGGKVPTPADLQRSQYVWQGWAWDIVKARGVPALLNDPYDKDARIRLYVEHIEDVRSYFKERPADLLEINLSDEDSYEKFCQFIGVRYEEEAKFPWENRGS